LVTDQAVATARLWRWLGPSLAVLAGLAVVAIGLRLAPRALPALDARTRWLVLLVFLSNFAVVSAAVSAENGASCSVSH
jgi:hypothetical protein